MLPHVVVVLVGPSFGAWVCDAWEVDTLGVRLVDVKGVAESTVVVVGYWLPDHAEYVVASAIGFTLFRATCTALVIPGYCVNALLPKRALKVHDNVRL